MELVESTITRIAKFDAKLNAVVVRDFDRARTAARIADEDRRAGRSKPLLGLPVTVKEGFDVAGLTTTWGVPGRHAAAQNASVLVERLKAAGAIVIGKSNVATMLSDWQTANPVYGITNNPWDMVRTPGGSSGGRLGRRCGRLDVPGVRIRTWRGLCAYRPPSAAYFHIVLAMGSCQCGVRTAYGSAIAGRSRHRSVGDRTDRAHRVRPRARTSPRSWAGPAAVQSLWSLNDAPSPRAAVRVPRSCPRRAPAIADFVVGAKGLVGSCGCPARDRVQGRTRERFYPVVDRTDPDFSGASHVLYERRHASSRLRGDIEVVSGGRPQQ